MNTVMKSITNLRLTRNRIGEGIRLNYTTLTITPETNGRMLPQFCPLKSVMQTSLGMHETVTEGAVINQEFIESESQHFRGEIPEEASSVATPTDQKVEKENVSSYVFTVDKNNKPLMPCHSARARKLLKNKRAVVINLNPFTIKIKDRIVEESALQPIHLKFDPGSKTTGVAILRNNDFVLHLAEIKHRGSLIKKQLQQRSGYRRRRRNINLRHRKERFSNRHKPINCLTPSLQHRCNNIDSWTNKYFKICPITIIDIETTKFDQQKMMNPDITANIEYQRGELFESDVWEYLLERDGRQCIYCGKINCSLEKEHIIPRSKGGTNRLSNIVLSCKECNTKKGNKSLEEFLKNKPDILARVKSQLKVNLSDAAVMNSTRKETKRKLEKYCIIFEWTGSRTKWNRNRLNIPKQHCLDAACVGNVNKIYNWNMGIFCIKSTGRGDYQRTNVNSNGFPIGYKTRKKNINGFITGDIVKAVITKGKRIGTYIGRVAVRARGEFDIRTNNLLIQSISWKYCKIISRNNGYDYSTKFLL